MHFKYTSKFEIYIVSILPIYSKMFETCVHDQLVDHFDQFFSKYQFGFRKGFNTQQCL